MAKSDPRVMHSHWTALLPVQAPLQPKPLTPHLLTVLLHDPLIKVRSLAASTIAVLLDGPAQRSILAVAEAKSMTARPPVRGFLTLSLSLGQLLLAAHTGLLHSVATEASGLVLPGVLRALVVLITSSPYERLPPELLPETIKVLRSRWAALSVASNAAAAGELAPIQAAYLACIAECFATKQPIAGLALYLQQQQKLETGPAAGDAADHPRAPGRSSGNDIRTASGALSPRATSSSGNRAGAQGGGAEQLVLELLQLASDPAVAAVTRIEALAALKGMAAHYTFVMPQAACKALGAAAAFPPVLAHAELSFSVSRALAGCLRDSVMSVRIAAGWAVANLCDAHRRRLEQLGPSEGQGGGGASVLESSEVRDGASRQQLLGGWAQSSGRASGAVQHGVSEGPHPVSRGTGAGGRDGGGGGGVQLDAWLDSALSCLQSTLTTGSMKVQWNACYALLGLLRNQRLVAHPRVTGRTAPLLLLLVMLVRDSANFKIRTHAAAALAALPSREAYGDVLPDALLVVAGALEGLSNGGSTASAAPAALAAVGAKGGTGPAGAADLDGDGGEGRIPNYRYAAGLSMQLRATLLHLLALAQPTDARRQALTVMPGSEAL
ncbi:hypothetical protein GPECTOR_1g642 [Gonium pectorale]|uniref:DUF4042 domain-containing protein n=1 Tax=Gonium pectorale TaxID=33097 RepID=A0A150H3T3_GONPE|nr:hypothetical protein GPECTOR_1g642 [Gonium pectorale]|eukprot:KXZ56713.1 hypothetical protein GPECTOR_1g642 [Gonium pectorale]